MLTADQRHALIKYAGECRNARALLGFRAPAGGIHVEEAEADEALALVESVLGAHNARKVMNDVNVRRVYWWDAFHLTVVTWSIAEAVAA